jgi:2'-5' RNA ligase
MRTFITLEFDSETKKKIADVQAHIKHNSESGRFKYTDNFHLTLKFLGEVENSKVNLMYEDLAARLEGAKGFNINLNGIGAFGAGEVIGTIYLNIEGEVSELINLARIVDEAAVKHGFKSDRSYTPHVTIAQQVKLNIPFDKLRQETGSIMFNNIFIDKVVIMKSEQIGKKRVYTPIMTIGLDSK